MNTEKVKCGEGNLEERIIYRGPSEKTMEVKNIARELFGRNIRLKRRGEDVPSPMQDIDWNGRNDEAKIWIEYVDRIIGHDLIRMVQSCEYEIYSVDLPKNTTDFRVEVDSKEIWFLYKNYEIMLYWKGYPQVILDNFHYRPRRKS